MLDSTTNIRFTSASPFYKKYVYVKTRPFHVKNVRSNEKYDILHNIKVKKVDKELRNLSHSTLKKDIFGECFCPGAFQGFLLPGGNLFDRYSIPYLAAVG